MTNAEEKHRHDRKGVAVEMQIHKNLHSNTYNK